MKKRFASLSASLQQTINDFRNDLSSVSEESEDPHYTIEDRIDHFIFQVAFFIRRKFRKNKLYELIFLIFATTPAIFINVIKALINVINGTLISPCFDVSGEAQMMDRIGRLKIIIYPNDHQPPHFHIKTEHYNLKFSIDDCEIILKKNDRCPLRSCDLKAIRKWHSENKSSLIEIWSIYNQSRY